MKTGKIAVPSMGETAESSVSVSFGRSPFIVIYDMEKKEYTAYANMGIKVQDGSGLKASKLIIQNNVDVLLTMEIGGKAYSVLLKEHVDIHLLKSTGSVKAAVNKYLKNFDG